VLSQGGAAGTGLLFLLLAVVLVQGAWPAVTTFGLRFFVTSDWDPVNLQFGALPMLVGTLLTSALALLLAVPVGVSAALSLERLSPRRVANVLGFLIEILAAIPSIGYGFWGVAVLVPFLQRSLLPFLRSTVGKLPAIGSLFSGPAYGFNILGSSLVLAIMILPIITLVSRNVIRAASRELEEGAYALGATWWQAIRLLLSSVKLGILGAVILAYSRAVGETMAVTMLIGNRNALPRSLFAPGQTMASLLANEFLEADKPRYVESLVYIALVLFLFTMVTALLARWLVSSVGRTAGVDGRPSSGGSSDDAPLSAEEVERARREILDQPLMPRARSIRLPWRSRVANRLAQASAVLSCLISVGILAFVIGYIMVQGVASLNRDFFTKLPGPVGIPSGMRNCIVGTGIMVAIACAWGVPLGLLTGTYLAEYKASPFQKIVRVVVDLLAGTPSIVVGVVVYQIVVMPMGHPSGWAGGVALGFLLSPIVARTTEDMLRLVPREMREASVAMGARHYQMLLGVVLPSAKGGILTGILLAVARIAGETAPLIFTALGNDNDVWNPNQPMPALTLKIFQYATSAEPEWIRQAWAGMLVLVFSVVLFSVAVRWSTSRLSVQTSTTGTG
jgi:phosphate ABC transporter permease protein PstC/phosphate ABC transporter permease subunit PstA